MNDIINYSVSKEESVFIKKGINVEIETFGDIISECKEIPYIGSLYKLGKIFTDFKDLCFVKRLAKFLSKSEAIPEDKKREFIESLEDKERKKISDFLMYTLYNSEEDVKAEILGFIYKYRLLGFFSEGSSNSRIENDYMLRLCHAVNIVYASNLEYLHEYRKEHMNDGISTDDLYHAGLLSMRITGTNSIPFTPKTIYQLNVYGSKLDGILELEKWYNNGLND